MIGRITDDPFAETVKNGEAKALFVQVELPTGDIRTVQLFPSAGTETWPCKGDVVVVERKGGLLYVSAIWDKAEPQLKPGEREIYGRNAGREKVSRIVFLETGEIQIETLKGESQIVLRETGEIELISKDKARYIFSDKHFIGNQQTNLCEVLLGIMDVIANLKTVGSPGAHTVDPSFIPEIDSQKEEIKKILAGEA
jgi:hypothetical protein